MVDLRGNGIKLLGRRVLVVDDNEDAVETMAMLLEMKGINVERAHDGPTALKAAELFDPQVVLLDIGLPMMDGYEVCQAIRRKKSRHRPLMVALTGRGRDADRRKSTAAGFDHHIVKPVSFDVLMKLLTNMTTEEDSFA